MATPLGHSLMGIALARRLGVRSPFGMAAAVVAASLPDADMILSYALHRDPWKIHRTFTHRPGFAVAAGLVLGASGVLSGRTGGPRDVVADALTGAALVGSHVVLDSIHLPYPPLEPGHPPGWRAYVVDAVCYGAAASALLRLGAEADKQKRA